MTPRGNGRVDARQRLTRWMAVLGLSVIYLLVAPGASGQIDPVQRRVFQSGYTQSMHEHGPLEAYGFYYHNTPDFYRSNVTLRLAVAPVYLDSQLGLRQILSENTDLGLGVAGGGFADTYSEIRDGNYFTDESFTGHAAEINASLYQLLNPGERAPLFAIVRGAVHRSIFASDHDTADNFEIPDDRTTFSVRTGLRLGGREPYLNPPLAGEISLWYEGQFRLDDDRYGFNGDRAVENNTHHFWTRALLAYTFEETGNYFELSLMGGTAVNADRFSAYRLGGSLPLIAEFPLTLPGYYRQELSAEQYFHASASAVFPLDPDKRVALSTFGALAAVDYLDGVEQPGNFNSGVGGGILYRTKSRAWQFGLAYAYGIHARREEGRGAHTITAVMQYDLDAEQRAGIRPFWDPTRSADNWRGFFDMFRGK